MHMILESKLSGISWGSSKGLFKPLILSQGLKLISESKIQALLNDLIEVQNKNYTLIRKFEK